MYIIYYMESSLEDILVNGLSYKLGNSKTGEGTADYIERRRMVTFPSVGSSSFTPGTGSKIIKFNLASDSWLDVSSVKVHLDIVNTDNIRGHKLRFVSNCHSLFERIVIQSGGTIIEDITDSNRVSQMLKFLDSKNSNVNDLGMSHGHEFREIDFNTIVFQSETFINGTVTDFSKILSRKINASSYPGINHSDRQTVEFSLPFGLFNCEKYIPMRYCPLTISLYLVNDMKLPLISQLVPVVEGVDAAATLAAELAADIALVKDPLPAVADVYSVFPPCPKTTFCTTNTSVQFRLENCEIKADVIDLNSSFVEQYHQHLAAGNTLNIRYTAHTSQMQTISKQSLANVMTSKAVKKLNKIYISFEKDGLETIRTPGAKTWRTFFSPLYDENSKLFAGSDDNAYIHIAEAEPKISVTMGGKQLVDVPLTSHSECYAKLVQSLGSNIVLNNYNSFNINPRQYRHNRFIVCIPLNRCPDAIYTGLNIANGDQINIKFETPSKNNIRIPDRMHIVTENEATLTIRANGVDVFE
jgi:hypothetical protein